VGTKGQKPDLFQTKVKHHMRRNPKLFYLVIVDHDKGVFAVEGPMADDTLWTDAVCRAQEEGRNVRCSSTTSDRTEVVNNCHRLGLVLVESSSIV
jgi:hypothetical protein